MDYNELAKAVIAGVGGEQNVDNVYHCATRLRFTLKDNALADKAKVEALDGVITVVEAGGMFQVVIGNTVNEVYEALVNQTNLGVVSEVSESKEKQGILNAFIDMIAGVFAPTLAF